MTTDRLGDAPIEPKYQEQMRHLARTLDHYFNNGLRGADRPTGLVLQVFPFNEAKGGRCNFVSNGANRKDLVALMKELIARFEGQPDITGKARR
jgi:hypothetical protein